MNVEELERQTRSSIEVDRNGKGDYSWKIKTYFEDDLVNLAINRVQAIDAELRQRFLKEE